MASLVPVTFFPTGATVLVPVGTTVAAAAAHADLPLSTPCGTRGICGECGVRVIFGALDAPDPTEVQTLRRSPAGVRLACRARVIRAVGIEPLVPASARALATGQARPGVPLVAGIDLGTTNVSAVVVDSVTGCEIAGSTVTNRQERFGSDVLTRLTAALEGAGEELAALAEESAAGALSLACEEAGVPTAAVERVVIAANTVMASLLMRLDVSGLAVHPFAPPFSAPAKLAPSSPSAAAITALYGAVVLPPIAGFVGGDALAAALATGLLSESSEPCLLVDVGTNAEMVLRSGRRLIVASAAAGPAFEGWGVASGGRAGGGAVDRVTVASGCVRLETGSGEWPDRYSGAGLVSALAALRALGWVEDDGRIATARVPAEHLATDADTGVASVLLGEGERSLPLTQLDIRALQLAKAAIRTGIDRVLATGGVDADSLAELLLSGAFGHALDADEAAAIGLVPHGVASRTRSVGNAALTGAALLAVSPEGLGDALGAAQSAEHLDLASDPAFQADLLAALRLVP